MRILIALLVLAAAPVQAASIVYLTDHRGVGASYGSYTSSYDGPMTSFYWEPCNDFAPDCDANAGAWNGAVIYDTHLRSQSVYGSGYAFANEQECSSEACSYITTYGNVAITLTVDEDSPYVYTSVIDGVMAPIQSGVLRAGEVFEVGAKLYAESWPDSGGRIATRNTSFGFNFSLGTSVPEPGTAAMLALGLAVTAARRRRCYPSE